MLAGFVCGQTRYRGQKKRPASGETAGSKTRPLVLQYDSAAPVQRSFDKRAVSTYNQDKEFAYIEKAKHKPKPSLWERFWKWFWSLFSVPSQPVPQPGKVPDLNIFVQILKYLGLTVGIGALVFIIAKIAGADIANIFKRTPKKAALPYSELLEDIHEIAFDDELDNAVGSRNYKLAVRLLYLRSLKQLNDAGLIHWQKDKTNALYLAELTDSAQQQSFGVLTRQFEYIWYGDFPVDGPAYQNISTLFHDFKLLLPL